MASFLAGLVVALGLVSAGFTLFAPDEEIPTVREGDVTIFEATQSSKEPTFMLFSHPVIGLVGVLIGARLLGRKSAAVPA